jgi:NifU-like protein involved in Fe-S cluster formation
MFSEPYSSRVLELAADIPGPDRLETPQGVAERVSRLCGSQVRVELSVRDGRIAEFAIDPKACALGQAAASVLARCALGATPAEVVAARDGLRAMLKDGAPAPGGRFWELRHLEPVRDYPPRHASTMLAFEAAVAALDQAGAR